jgi:hypothetical protein
VLIIQALITTVTRSAGKIFNMAFGWATIMLFGKVPQDRQRILTLLAGGSLVWMVAVVGVLVPQFATWLFALVTLPSWVRDEWIRLAMLAGTILTPPLIGAASMFVIDPATRPQGVRAKAAAVLRGYPYAFGLAITLVMMVVFAPIMHIRSMIRRWKVAHVAVIVEPENYLTVVDEIQAALRTAGYDTTQTPASWMLRLPMRILTTFARSGLGNLVSDNLTTLRSDRVEVALYPADLVVRGREGDVARIRAVIAQHLTFVAAYMTWTAEANALEDRLRTLWDHMKEGEAGVPRAERAEMRSIEQAMSKAELPYEEWEVLFREKLVVERGMLQVLAGVTDRPLEPTEAPPDEITARAEQGEGRSPVLQAVPVAAGAAAIGLLAGRWLGQRETADEEKGA